MKCFFIVTLFFCSISLFSQQDSSTDAIETTTATTSTIITSPTNNQPRKQKDGWDLYAEGNYTASIKALDEEKKQFPTRINIFIILGWNYKAIKNYKEMEKISLEGFALNPTHINVLKNLGEAYFFQGKYQDAIKQFEKYLKIRNDWNDPNTHLIYTYLGTSYFHTGYLFKADLALSTANSGKSNNVQTLLLLAEINEKLEKKEKAISYYEKALIVDPINNTAKTAISRLKKG